VDGLLIVKRIYVTPCLSSNDMNGPVYGFPLNRLKIPPPFSNREDEKSKVFEGHPWSARSAVVSIPYQISWETFSVSFKER
jgi:hypothetical protein